MATDHVVQQGEHLARIAAEHGFSDYRTIWDHPSNAALKQKRKNPDVLHPGDRLHIPDRELREESRPTDQKHRFKAKVPKLVLRVVLEDMYRRPIAHAPCELILDGDTHPLTTDGRGKIELTIPTKAETGTLVVKAPESAIQEQAIPVRVGHLDPVEEESGQRGRLNNLGYFAGPFGDRDEADNDKAFKSAIEEFQCDHGLQVDGVCGPRTQAKLKEVHGS
jgi:N-acetylmuramoyl-L-alanine amidase